MRVGVLILVASLAACAGQQQPATTDAPAPVSWVAPDAIRNPADAERVAAGMAELVTLRLPQGGTVRVEPAPEGDSAIGAAFAEALRKGGHRVVDDTSATHRIGYGVARLDNGVLVRVRASSGLVAGRFLPRGKGGALLPAGGGSVMEIAP